MEGHQAAKFAPVKVGIVWVFLVVQEDILMRRFYTNESAI